MSSSDLDKNKNNDSKDQSKGLPTWAAVSVAILGVLLGGGGIASIIVAVINRPVNSPPTPVITVDDPLTSSTNQTIEVYSNQKVRFNAYASNDDEDGSDLQFLWSLDGQNVSELPEYTTEPLTSIDSPHRIVLKAKDKDGVTGTSFLRIKIIKVSPSSNEIDTNSKETRTPYNWLRANAIEPIPENALIVGFEYENSRREDPLYLCRGSYQGKILPGKIISSGECFIPFYTLEDNQVKDRYSVPISDYEVLIPKGSSEWVLYDATKPPQSFLSVDENNESIVCRARYGAKNSLGNYRVAYHPGVLDLTIGKCMFPWGDVVGYLGDYEVLEFNK